jgi:hypothetical protein
MYEELEKVMEQFPEYNMTYLSGGFNVGVERAVTLN